MIQYNIEVRLVWTQSSSTCYYFVLKQRERPAVNEESQIKKTENSTEVPSFSLRKQPI